MDPIQAMALVGCAIGLVVGFAMGFKVGGDRGKDILQAECDRFYTAGKEHGYVDGQRVGRVEAIKKFQKFSEGFKG